MFFTHCILCTWQALPLDIIIENKVWNSVDIVKDADGLITGDWEIYKNISIIGEAGKKIPEDFGIVGINDSNYSRLCFPELTAMRNGGDAIAKECCELLIDRIKSEEKKEMRIKRIPCKLIERNT